ncbi:MAG: type VI secretion system baseplate subunit TssG [Desulfobacteraceae bacterium]|jgi:type VI secretion system protein ImpH
MIKEDLLTHGRCFSLFQAVRLVRHMLEQGSDGSAMKAGRQNGLISGLRVKPHLSLGFPLAGVEQIDETDQGVFTITSNILGLYGAGSPLPTFYTEELFTDDAKGCRTVRDMIDVVNHRLFMLLFDAWSMYKSMIRIVEAGDDALIRRFYNVIGMDERSLEQEFKDPRILLRYSGLFAMNSRSASGLETMLADAFNVPIRIIQMVERKGLIPEDQRGRLGMNIRLGIHSSIGRAVTGRGGAFRIEIGPVTNNDYQRFVPGTKEHDLLVSLTGLYVSSPLEYDVEIIMNKKEKPRTVCLGGECFSRLGLDTWVFSNEGPDEFRTRFHQ